MSQKRLSFVLSERAVCGVNLATETLERLKQRGLLPPTEIAKPPQKNRNLKSLAVCMQEIKPAVMAEVIETTVSQVDVSKSYVAKRLRRLEKRGHTVALFSSTPFFILEALIDKIEVIDRMNVVTPRMEPDGSFADFDYSQATQDYLNDHVSAYLNTCFGSGVNDAAIMQKAINPVAVNPQGQFKDMAKAHRWEIIHT